MKITEVRVNKYSGKGKLVGFADIVVENCLKINGFRIIDGSNGLFVAMPSTPFKNKESGETEYKDNVYPTNKEFRNTLNNAILDKFKGNSSSSGNDDKDDMFG